MLSRLTLLLALSATMVETTLSAQLRGNNPIAVERNLAECDSFRTIEVAIAYDSYWCDKYGNGSKAGADAKVEYVVSEASKYFEEADGLCIKLEVSHIDGYCNSNNDPYYGMLENQNVAGSFEALYAFQDHWNQNHQSVHRDIAHLFTANPSCRSKYYSKSVCSSQSAYTIDAMVYDVLDSNLIYKFSHYLGLNAGASKDYETSGYIMSSPSGGYKGFSSESVNQMNSFLNTRTCLAGAPEPTPPPTVIIETTAAPTDSSDFTSTDITEPPTTAPTKSPVANPGPYPACDICDSANIGNPTGTITLKGETRTCEAWQTDADAGLLRQSECRRLQFFADDCDC